VRAWSDLLSHRTTLDAGFDVVLNVVKSP
jgi:hypothetical protein